MSEILILITGLAGVIVRYFLTSRCNDVNITTIINLSACLLLAFILKYNLGEYLLSFTAAFSTLSTYNFELLTNYKKNKSNGIKYFIVNVLGALVLFAGVIIF